MKKLLAIMLILALSISLFSCGVGNGTGGEGAGGEGEGSGDTQGGNGNGNGGTADGGDSGNSGSGTAGNVTATVIDKVQVLYGEGKDSESFEPENVTHSDPAVAEFISEKITFRSLVYPDGIPKEIAPLVKGVAVELHYQNEYLAEMLKCDREDTENGGNDAFMENFTLAGEYINNIENALTAGGAFSVNAYKRTLNGYAEKFGSVIFLYESYQAFAETDLAKLAALTENIPDSISIYLETYPISSSHVCNASAAPVGITLKEYETEFVNKMIEKGVKLEFSGDGAEAVVAGWKYFDAAPSAETATSGERFIELVGDQYCEHCLLYTTDKVGVIEGDSLFTDEDGDYTYVLISFPKYVSYTNAYEFDVKRILIDGGKMTVEASFMVDGYTAPGYFSPYILLKIDNTKLTTNIEEFVLSTLELEYVPAYDGDF